MSHKVKILFYVSALVIVGILSGCQPSKVSESITPLPTPNPTEGIVSGTLVDMDGKPIQNIPVRMAQVYRQGEEGAFVLDTAHSPSSITSSKGDFILTNIPPAEYFLVIGTPEDNNYIVYQDKDGKPVSYIIKAGELVEIQKIKVDFYP